MQITLSSLHQLITNKFTSTYYTADQASLIAEVLMYAETSGKNTQGVMKLIGTEPMQNVKPAQAPKITKETKLATLIDGGGNAAPLVCQQATDILISKCKEHGMAIVGTHNTFASSGAIGFYAEKIAQNNLIGLVFAGSPGGVAPFGGVEPLFGTNPLAFGFPTLSQPLIFDMATSAITWYGLVRAKALGENLPAGVAIDSEGNPTLDADKAMNGGAILPFAKDYKSSGLSMMIEILTGPLVGGTFCTPNGDGDWSNLFIAIDPNELVGLDEFKTKCSELIKIVKDSKKQKGFDEILVAGERALKNRQAAVAADGVEIEDKILAELGFVK